MKKTTNTFFKCLCFFAGVLMFTGCEDPNYDPIEIKNLQPKITTADGFLYVENKDSFAYVDAEVIINDTYCHKAGTIAPGEMKMIPMILFENEYGIQFTAGKVAETIEVGCALDGTNDTGFYYGGR
jgi:hypothetical protein